jgi:hypothetical protein
MKLKCRLDITMLCVRAGFPFWALGFWVLPFSIPVKKEIGVVCGVPLLG